MTPPTSGRRNTEAFTGGASAGDAGKDHIGGGENDDGDTATKPGGFEVLGLGAQRVELVIGRADVLRRDGDLSELVGHTYEPPVLDMSHDAMNFLFEGATYGACGGTPLGPE